MGRCPNCGAWSFLTPKDKCIWCGKVVCGKCLPKGKFVYHINIKEQSDPSKPPVNNRMGFCSPECLQRFKQELFEYPVEEISQVLGTDVGNFRKNAQKVAKQAVLRTLTNCSPKPDVQRINKIKQAPSEEIYCTGDDEGNPIGVLLEFREHSRTMLAQNLERSGRFLDAAKVYEELKMYDKAGELRKKDKLVLVRRTNISINLKDLLQQVKDGGIVAGYRCPHCNGTLKIGKDTSPESLKTCQYCGAQIETVDLADFLKSALS